MPANYRFGFRNKAADLVLVADGLGLLAVRQMGEPAGADWVAPVSRFPCRPLLLLQPQLLRVCLFWGV